MSVKFQDLRSRTPDAEFRTVNRLDPFWDHVWERGSVAQWKSRRRSVARSKAGLSGEFDWFTPSGVECVVADERFHSLRRDVKLGLLGVLDSWRTVTVEQAAAMLDSGRMFNGGGSLLRDLFASDLVDVGHAEGFTSGSFTKAGLREWLLRPTRSARFRELVEPRLTFPELVQVCGGADFLTGGQYDRHNILAVELMLRLAEFTNVRGVLGERWSTASDLLFDGWGARSPFPYISNRADFVFVRPDGLRVAVELTASAGGSSFERKVDKWAQQMAAGSLGSQGTVVLFVSVGDQFPVPGENDVLHRQVRNSVARAVRRFPGSPGGPVAERFFVAGWHELFPAPGRVVDGFDRLPVRRASGLLRLGSDSVWEDTHLLDEGEVPFSPVPGADVSSLVLNSRMLHGSPWWLREGARPQVALDAVRALWPAGPPGFTREDLKPRGGTPAAGLPERVRI